MATLDMAQLHREHPDTICLMLAEVLSMFESGKLRVPESAVAPLSSLGQVEEEQQRSAYQPALAIQAGGCVPVSNCKRCTVGETGTDIT